MRGEDANTAALFSYLSCEARVPADHPLRPIRVIVDKTPEGLSPVFAELYAQTGRPSIPPEKLLRALLLQAFYSVRSERQLMEQLDYNLLFRWFVGLAMDAPVWDATVFTKEPGAAAGGRCRGPLYERSARAAARQDTVVGRALFGGRYADRSVGQHEELSPKGRRRRAAGARAQRRARFSRREAQ